MILYMSKSPRPRTSDRSRTRMSAKEDLLVGSKTQGFVKRKRKPWFKLLLIVVKVVVRSLMVEEECISRNKTTRIQGVHRALL
jgi:hypothetical protein